jgi:hypothetical protein
MQPLFGLPCSPSSPQDSLPRLISRTVAGAGWRASWRAPAKPKPHGNMGQALCPPPCPPLHGNGLLGRLQTGGQVESPLKKALSQHVSPTKHLKFSGANHIQSLMQECPEVDFGSFSTMSVPTLSFSKSETST